MSFASPHIGELTVYSDDDGSVKPYLTRVDPVVVLTSTRTTVLVTRYCSESGATRSPHPPRAPKNPRCYSRPGGRSPTTNSSRQTKKPFENPPLPIHQTTNMDWMTISTSFASSGLTLMGFTKCYFIKFVLVRGDPSLSSSCGFAHRPAPPRIVIRRWGWWMSVGKGLDFDVDF